MTRLPSALRPLFPFIKTGVLRAMPPANYASYYVGIPPVVADLYNDGNAYLTQGAHIWKFDGPTSA